jgi:hypothetical protein
MIAEKANVLLDAELGVFDAERNQSPCVALWAGYSLIILIENNSTHTASPTPRRFLHCFVSDCHHNFKTHGYASRACNQDETYKSQLLQLLQRRTIVRVLPGSGLIRLGWS